MEKFIALQIMKMKNKNLQAEKECWRKKAE